LSESTQLSCRCSWYLSGFVWCSTSTLLLSMLKQHGDFYTLRTQASINHRHGLLYTTDTGFYTPRTKASIHSKHRIYRTERQFCSNNYVYFISCTIIIYSYLYYTCNINCKYVPKGQRPSDFFSKQTTVELCDSKFYHKRSCQLATFMLKRTH